MFLWTVCPVGGSHAVDIQDLTCLWCLQPWPGNSSLIIHRESTPPPRPDPWGFNIISSSLLGSLLSIWPDLASGCISAQRWKHGQLWTMRVRVRILNVSIWKTVQTRAGANYSCVVIQSFVTMCLGVLGWAPREEDAKASRCVPEVSFRVDPRIMGREVRRERGGSQTECIHEQLRCGQLARSSPGHIWRTVHTIPQSCLPEDNNSLLGNPSWNSILQRLRAAPRACLSWTELVPVARESTQTEKHADATGRCQRPWECQVQQACVQGCHGICCRDLPWEQCQCGQSRSQRKRNRVPTAQSGQASACPGILRLSFILTNIFLPLWTRFETGFCPLSWKDPDRIFYQSLLSHPIFLLYFL